MSDTDKNVNELFDELEQRIMILKKHNNKSSKCRSISIFLRKMFAFRSSKQK